jgi:hypothetical protein
MVKSVIQNNRIHGKINISLSFNAHLTNKYASIIRYGNSAKIDNEADTSSRNTKPSMIYLFFFGK